MDASLLMNVLDHNLITGNLASYGEGAVLPFNQLPVDMASLRNPYLITSVMSITAGVCVLAPAAGTIAVFIQNPGMSGRRLSIISNNINNTCSVATAGGLAGFTTVTFNAIGSGIDLISISATVWRVLNSNAVTLS
jgi:hypothetical protein